MASNNLKTTGAKSNQVNFKEYVNNKIKCPDVKIIITNGLFGAIVLQLNTCHCEKNKVLTNKN